MTVSGDTSVARVRQDDLIPGYRLVQLVGKGGMGEVHQAVQLSLGRTVALKLLKPELARDEQFVARFEKEASALATLRHPNVVSIVDRGKASEAYYLVMEFVDGPSLRERMRDPDFDTLMALKVLSQVARAIDYAHHRGVIHRDLKPENILFDEQAGGIPKVTDFGLAGFDEKAVLGLATPQHLTQTNVAMGTAAYMAPEQRVDAKTAGPKADLYSLGVMLYELVTGELPLGQFDPPSVKKPGVDKRLDVIVSRCLKPAPEDRFASVADFLTELELLVPMTVAPSPSKETKARRFWRLAKERAQRVGRVVSLVVVAFAAILIGTAFVRAGLERPRQPAGFQLMRDDGAQFPSTMQGRLDRATRALTLGEGPDTVTVVARGRPVASEQGALVFGEPDDAPVGRALLDVEAKESGFVLSVEVDTQPVEASALEPLYALFRGPRADARSTLMVVGPGDRYVAIVVSGSGGQPELEWNLGPDKQGRTSSPLRTVTAGQRLTLALDPVTSELVAFIGEGRDARVLGEPVRLGETLQEEFAPSARAAFGCLEGACAFRSVRFQGWRREVSLSPPPPPPLEVDVDDLPTPKMPRKPTVAAKPPVKPTTVAATKPVPPKAPVVTKKPPAPVAPKKK